MISRHLLIRFKRLIDWLIDWNLYGFIFLRNLDLKFKNLESHPNSRNDEIFNFYQPQSEIIGKIKILSLYLFKSLFWSTKKRWNHFLKIKIRSSHYYLRIEFSLINRNNNIFIFYFYFKYVFATLSIVSKLYLPH